MIDLWALRLWRQYLSSGINSEVNDDEVMHAVAGLGYDTDDMLWVGSGGEAKDVLAVPLRDGEDWYPQWEKMRELVAATGRWPVACDQPAGERRGEYREFLRFEFGADRDRPATDFIAAAGDADPDQVFKRHEPWVGDDGPMGQFASVVRDLEISAKWRTEAETDALIDTTSAREVERFLVRKQIEDGERIPLGLPGVWGDTGGYEPTWVVLPPDSSPVNGLAYVATFCSRPVEALPVAWRWAAEHQVELVAGFSCWYLFQMPAPVADPEAAWRMGVELIELWDCSFGGGPAFVHAVHIAAELASNTRFDGATFP